MLDDPSFRTGTEPGDQLVVNTDRLVRAIEVPERHALIKERSNYLLNDSHSRGHSEASVDIPDFPERCIRTVRFEHDPCTHPTGEAEVDVDF